ncbi:MAG TPA: FMN-binding protein [Bacillota bacterium]|nr:FMN-binding protein [Bacillota bacterium]
MKSYAKMLVFIIILGAVTSLIFVGMEVWTAPLIEANAALELKSTILDANGEAYTIATANQAFAEAIETFEQEDLTLYRHKGSGSLSYEFSGSGVWGPIVGIITLESDLETIRHLRVLQQEETPGLGGVVADPTYLQGYFGVHMVPELAFVVPGSERLPNQVDRITGATRTSNSFRTILNSSYLRYLEFMQEVGD